MTDPVVRLDPARAVVEPGGQVTVTVTVANTGQIVEGYRLTVHGAAADWAEVVPTRGPDEREPDVLRVYPGQESSATVVFTAPSGAAGTAGAVAFCCLARSVVDPGRSAAAEGDLEVGRVHGLTASVTPVTSTGRWSGRHTLKVSNWGNAATTLRLLPSDPDGALAFLVHPDRLELPVGASAVAAVRVRSRRPFLRGTPVRLPFRVVADPDPPLAEPVAAPGVSDPRRPVVDGALDQRAVLSRGTVALGALGAVVLTAATVLVVAGGPAPAAEEPRPDVTVLAPRGLVAEAVDATTVRLSWDPFERPPDQIRVFLVDPATQDENPPSRVERPRVEGASSSTEVGELDPATEVCFQLSSVRGEAEGSPTEVRCVTTPPAPPETVPDPTPTTPESTPEPTPQPTPQPTPEPTPEPTSSPPDGEPEPTESSPPTTATPTTPPTDGDGGPDPTATPTPAAPGSEAPDPDAWLLVRPVPQGQRTTEAHVRQMSADLERAIGALEREDLGVTVLEAAEYPGLQWLEGTVVVAVGPFGSAEEARAACPDLGIPATSCVARQPGSPR